MAYYIKDICKLAQLDFKEAIDEVTKVNPSFKVKGGPQTEIDFGTFKATCQNHNIEVTDDGHIRIHKDTDGGNVRFAPYTVAKPEIKKVNPNEVALENFNKFKADKIDPLKVKAEMEQAVVNTPVALEFIKNINKREKTILNESLIHDFPYMTALFQGFPYIIMPVQLGQRIRKRLTPMFIKSYITGDFHDKIIAFSKDKVLYAFIINV